MRWGRPRRSSANSCRPAGSTFAWRAGTRSSWSCSTRNLPEPSPAEDEGGTARITLRLPESTKSRVEQRADGEGVSTNTWLIRAINRGLEHERHEQQQRRRMVGNRITGMAES